ncbi:MAG: hypothetical protein II628_16065, partial [Lachnospiraceae bacterium]|nr:hypothetical protein [Lachnospiraceae bacterium]
EEEIDAFRRKHMHFRSVREYFIKKAREEGNTQEEIRLLNQSREQDADSLALVHLYTQRLIEIYQGLGDLEKEKAERREALMRHPMTTLDDFKVYKSLCGREEWEKAREDIIRARQDEGKKAEFLAEENMLEELYQLICQQKDIIGYLDKYGFLLADLYPEQILEQYEAYVCSIAEKARNRSWYDELLRYLRRMQQYRGGREVVEKLCRKWILAYPTRKVLVSELGRMLREQK